MNTKRAVVLSSGGLDSKVAAHVMSQHPVDLMLLYFTNPFNRSDDTVRELVKKTALQISAEFRNEVLGQDYLDLIVSPKFGYGKHMNPCIDCRIHMLKKAKQIMLNESYDFIVTGEVLGQRPMSQYLRSINLIERESDLGGLILRPLSANILEDSLPEAEGWVDREKLYSLNGRSRKGQMVLINEFKIDKADFLAPGGGCSITTRDYSLKLKDFLKYSKKLTIQDVKLLNYGRHFRISPSLKLIVGRDEKDNEMLNSIAERTIPRLYASYDKPGPVCLLVGEISEEELIVSAGICGFFMRPKSLESIDYSYETAKEIRTVSALPFDRTEIFKYKIY